MRIATNLSLILATGLASTAVGCGADNTNSNGQPASTATGPVQPGVQPSGAFDPQTGLPIQPVATAPGQVQPVGSGPGQPPAAPIDPVTGTAVPPGVVAPGGSVVQPPGTVAPQGSLPPGSTVAPPTTVAPVGTDPVGPTPTDPVDPGPAGPTSDAGWYTTKGWSGCVWTGVEEGAQSSIAPRDFLTTADGGPYCVKGEVAADPDYESVALLGFNTADMAGADCTAKPLGDTVGTRPAIEPTADGIAVNFVKQGTDTGFTWRVQIEGPDGSTDANQRWCATISATQGKVFVPYDKFDTECWFVDENGEPNNADYAGQKYDMSPISAVVFTVPGNPTAVPYEFCVNGFAEGSTADDAPDGSAVAATERGTVGYADTSPDGDFDRKKVTAGGLEYIIQNNNWGNPSGSDLILDFEGNSFKITQANGSSPGNGIPASFPSIFIGDNGNKAGGVVSTNTDPLPIKISAIQSAQTTFKWNGADGDFNATYDVWFANQEPTTEYKDGIDGFIMVWLYKPGSRQPIGSVQASGVSVPGVSGSWDVWVGPRGDGPEGYNDATVVSYVSTSKLNSLSFDLKNFMTHASSYGIGSEMFLTDVFGGFEIWGGGSNLEMQEFSIDVK